MSDSHPLLEIYKKGQDAADKFDYFVCGVTGAVLTYIAQQYSPKPLAIDVHLLEPVAILILAGSFFCGLTRLRWCAAIIHVDFDLGHAREKNDLPKVEALTGLICSARATAKRLYTWRDRLLYVGFFAIFLAKVLQPYGADSSAHATATAQPSQIQSPAAHPVSSPVPSPLPAAVGTNTSR